MSFVAAANMTMTVGAKPVFADIVSLHEPTIDPADIERKITPRTRAIVVMHYGGYACRMAEIMALAERHGIPVIEDACHAPGQTDAGMNGRHLGTIGAIGCFSFFSNKNMTCGEGGMVVTNDDLLAERIKALPSHGMTTLSWERHQGRASTYDVTLNGFNYRLDDLRAALASVQLAKLPAANDRRRKLAQRYANRFQALAEKDVFYVFADRPEDGTAHVAALVVAERDRDRIRQVLGERGIQTSLHYPPIHLFSAFTGGSIENLTRTEEFARRVITLPLYPGLGVAAVDEIVASIGSILRMNAAEACCA